MVQVARLSPSQTIWHEMPLYKAMVRAPSKQDLESFKIFLKALCQVARSDLFHSLISLLSLFRATNCLVTIPKLRIGPLNGPKSMKI